MTTERQATANSRNALKSTGPKTEEGKTVSAQNATSHGLAKPLDWNDVMSYHRLLLAEAGLREDASLEDPLPAATLALAQAEAGLARARDAEEAFLKDLAEGKDLAPYLRRASEIVKEISRSVVGASPELSETLLASRRLPGHEVRHIVREHWTAPHRHLQKLVKYRRAAEVSRRKALGAWTCLREESSERSQIQP